jgi:hypothetical protein
MVQVNIKNLIDEVQCYQTIRARSYGIPGSYAPMWSGQRSSFVRPLNNKNFEEKRVTKKRVGRSRHMHDPGIQQEPTRFS